MTDGIYIGMAGAAARLAQLDAVADNLANVETPGFRAARPRFESFLPPTAPKDAPAYVGASHVGVDTHLGAMKATGRALDVRLDEGAWLGVQVPDADGAHTRYTRDGRLDLDSEGRLTAGGNLALGASGGPIHVPEGGTISIDGGGRVLRDGEEIDRLFIVRLDGEVSRAGPTVVEPDDPTAVTPIDARLHPGELEMSNSSALESTVALVSAQRAYDHAMQAIQTSRSLDQRGSELGRIRG